MPVSRLETEDQADIHQEEQPTDPLTQKRIQSNVARAVNQRRRTFEPDQPADQTGAAPGDQGQGPQPDDQQPQRGQGRRAAPPIGVPPSPTPLLDAMHMPIHQASPETQYDFQRMASATWATLMDPNRREPFTAQAIHDNLRQRLWGSSLTGDSHLTMSPTPSGDQTVPQPGAPSVRGGKFGLPSQPPPTLPRGGGTLGDMISGLGAHLQQLADTPYPQAPTVVNLQGALSGASQAVEGALGSALQHAAVPFDLFGEAFYSPPDSSWPTNYRDLSPEQLNIWWGQYGLAGTPGTVGGEALAAARAVRMTQAGQRTVQAAWQGMAGAAALGRALPGSDLAVNHFVPGFVRISQKLHNDLQVVDTVSRLRTPKIDEALTENPIDAALKIPPAESITRRAKGGPAETTFPTGPRPGPPASVDEQIVQVSQVPEADRKRFFKKLGVSNLDEFRQMAEGKRFSATETDWIAKNWRKYFPYDLRRVDPESLPLRDPRPHLETMAPENKQNGLNFMAQSHLLLTQIRKGPWASERALAGSALRSLAGLDRATGNQVGRWQKSLVTMLGDLKGIGEEERRALEGDMAAYDALSPERKMYVDVQRMLDAMEAQLSQQAGRDLKPIPNFYPRRFVRPPSAVKRRPGARSAAVFAAPMQKHREEALAMETPEQAAARAATEKTPDKQPRAILQQRFLTVDETNNAIADERLAYVNELTTAESSQAELEAARQKAEEAYPFMVTNAYRTLGDLEKRVKALHTQQAANMFVNSIIEDGGQFQAAYRGPQSRDVQEFLRNRGYQRVTVPGLEQMQFHPRVASAINAVVEAQRQGGPGLEQALRAIERKAVRFIMYFPMIHGLNVAGRAGWYWTANPTGFTQQLLQTLAIDRRMHADAAIAHGERRLEAYSSGVMPPAPFRNYGSEMYQGPALAAGDAEMGTYPGLLSMSEAPEKHRSSPLAGPLGLGRAVSNGWEGLNNILWQGVDNFAVTVYHVEKAKALNSGVDEARARLYAADRANAWAGHVRPENWNRQYHNLSRLAFFAPNWWRTYGALMTGVYDRTGLVADATLRGHIVRNELKTIAAAAIFQKVLDNGLNLALSGHPQWENQPGNQDRLELDNFAPILERLMPDQAKRLQETGGHWTLEPFLTRQTFALEKAAGLEGPESTQTVGGAPVHGYHMEDAPGYLWTEFAGRLSPLLNALGAVGNVDLYHSFQRSEVHRIDPQHGGLVPGEAQILAALSALSPLGSTVMQNVSTVQQQGPGPEVPLLDLPGMQGTTVPKNLRDMLGAGAGKLLLGLLGINPPYVYASRSVTGAQGQHLQFPKQDALLQVKQKQDDYHRFLQTLGTSMFSGATTPDKALKDYQDTTTKYQAYLSSVFQNAPYYTHGPLGLFHQWEDIYRQATVTAPDGHQELDWVKVDDLQAAFEHSHTQAEMQAVHSYTTKQEVTSPFLKTYHDTINAYRAFQQSEAGRLSVALPQLRRDISEYGRLFNDRKASAAFLHQHPAVVAYEKAKRQWEVSNYAGLMYGMFYSTGTVLTWLRQHGMDERAMMQQIARAEGVSGTQPGAQPAA